MNKPAFVVLLYYKYIDIKNPQEVRDNQIKLCQSLDLKGRIIIAKEGINGTVEGTTRNTEKYMKAMKKYNISFKKSFGNGSSFPKLSVKVRPEIVASKVEVNPNKNSGKYINADKLNEWFEKSRKFFIVDMRNDYEQFSGFFENSVFSGMHNFSQLASVLPRLKHLKNKTVVTVCTGGVRCEKASGFLKLNGFSDVYQLKDGIQSYMEKYPDQKFKGRLYVFDNRLTIGFDNRLDREIVGRCMHCGKEAEDYVNCSYDFCHYHYICCKTCRDRATKLAFCKPDCKEKYLQK